jgi:hypothetical protein
MTPREATGVAPPSEPLPRGKKLDLRRQSRLAALSDGSTITADFQFK